GSGRDCARSPFDFRCEKILNRAQHAWFAKVPDPSHRKRTPMSVSRQHSPFRALMLIRAVATVHKLSATYSSGLAWLPTPHLKDNLMFPKRTFFAALVSAFTLAGCSTSGDASKVSQYKAQFANTPPTTEWLEKETATLREQAWTEPTESNVEVFAFVSSELEKRLYVEE